MVYNSRLFTGHTRPSGHQLWRIGFTQNKISLSCITRIPLYDPLGRLLWKWWNEYHRNTMGLFSFIWELNPNIPNVRTKCWKQSLILSQEILDQVHFNVLTHRTSTVVLEENNSEHLRFNEEKCEAMRITHSRDNSSTDYTLSTTLKES